MVTARVYILLITCLLLLGLFFTGVSWWLNLPAFGQAAGYLLTIASLGAGYYLFSTGSLTRSWPRPYYFLLLGLLTLGVLFKIQHWTGGALLVDVSLAGIGILYLAWYRSKPNRRLPDHLKAVWVTAYCGYTLLKNEHFSLPYLSEYLLSALLWIILALVLSEQRRQEQQRRMRQESFSPELREEES